MTANSATTNTAFMRAMAFVPKSAMSTHTHEMPANSAQRIHSSLQPNANRMALPSCTVPTARTPTSRNIHTREPAAEPFVPKMYRRLTTLLGRPSRNVILPTRYVSTKLKANVMAMATPPSWQPA